MGKLQGWAEQGGQAMVGIVEPPGPPVTTISSLLGPAVVSACDFPGADAAAKIANAITGLPSVGGTVDAHCLMGFQTVSSNPFAGVTKPVHLMLGAVSLQTSVSWVIPSNTRISGIGEASQILVAPGTGVYTTSDINILTTNGASNVIIEQLRVTGAGKNYPGSNLSFGGAISIVGSTNVVVDKVICENVNIGIAFDNSSDCRATNNFVHGHIAQEGIRVFTTPGNVAQRNVIANNVLDWEGFAGVSGSGIDASGQNNTNIPVGTVIIGNAVRGTGAEGFLVFHAEQTTITGNVSIGNNYGMAIYGGRNNVLSNNVVRDCPVAGILLQTLQTGDVLDDNIVSGNTVYNSSTNASDDVVYVSADNGGASANNNQIVGNTLVGGAGSGVHVVTATGTLVDRNVILTSGANGIFLASTAGQTTVRGNFVLNPAGHGITTGAAAGLNVSSNTFQQVPLVATRIGITSNATASIFSGNLIQGFSAPTSILGTGCTVGPNSDHTYDVYSTGALPAASGAINLSNNQGIYFRNQGNTADRLGMMLDSSNFLVIGELTTSNTNVRGGASIDFQTNGVSVMTANLTDVTLKKQLFLTTFTFAALGTPANGAMVYCSDCVGGGGVVTTPCAGGGSGAFAFRRAGGWECL